MSGKEPDAFVIRGSAAAIERMGGVTASRLYKADHNGDLPGEVWLADGVTMRRVRASVGPHDALQQDADECAATAVGSVSGEAWTRLRTLVEDALAASGRRK